MELSSAKLKKLFTFPEGTCKARRSKISHFLFVER